MKLKSLLVQLIEGVCERLPNESDEDFLTRCGNAGFDKMDRLRMAQNNMVWNRNVMKEAETSGDMTQKITNKEEDEKFESVNTQPSSALRTEPHPTRHETEHPSYEKDALKYKGKYTPPTKK